MMKNQQKQGGDMSANSWLLKHGHRPKSGCSSTYRSWLSMKKRCSDEKNQHYKGRGIKLCERWIEFSNFLEDMGERPKNTTLDRIDVEGDYCPENCKWSTNKEQARNKRCNLLATINGETKCIKDWADQFHIPTTTIYRRFHAGVRGIDLITKPRFKRPNGFRAEINDQDA